MKDVKYCWRLATKKFLEYQIDGNYYYYYQITALFKKHIISAFSGISLLKFTVHKCLWNCFSFDIILKISNIWYWNHQLCHFVCAEFSIESKYLKNIRWRLHKIHIHLIFILQISKLVILADQVLLIFWEEVQSVHLMSLFSKFVVLFQ